MFRILFLYVSIMIVFGTTAWGSEDRKRVAVWEIIGIGMDQSLLRATSEQIRQGAVDVLPSAQYEVITRDNVILYLKENGGSCDELSGECKITIGQKIDAQYMVFGELLKLEQKYILTIKLHDSATGQMISMSTVYGNSASDLTNNTRSEASNLFRFGLNLSFDETTGEQKKETSPLSIPVGDSSSMIVLSSSTDKAPTSEIERLIWFEDRKKELYQQIKKARTEAEQLRQYQANEMWKKIEPYANTGSYRKMLSSFIEEYEGSTVTVRYIDPSRGETHWFRNQEI